VRCAPPDNKPTVSERDTCGLWLDREVAVVLPGVRVVLCLGGFAWSAALGTLARAGCAVPRPRPRFGHGAEAAVAGPPGAPAEVVVLGTYHPSQQNTFTGRLTEAMLDDVLGRAVALAGIG
jgi:uracil-DNA glycosylase